MNMMLSPMSYCYNCCSNYYGTHHICWRRACHCCGCHGGCGCQWPGWVLNPIVVERPVERLVYIETTKPPEPGAEKEKWGW